LRAGEISVCPAQEHVVINPDATISVSQRRRVRSFRPSANWMFESAAASFRERAFAVVLSGFQNDGADGVVAIRRAGGTVIVQHPDACEHPDMPRAAIATGAVNFILDPDQIPVVLTTLLNDVDLQQCRLEWESPFRCGIETSPLPAA
jgi:two-component system chemotaxis response regulator CheB